MRDLHEKRALQETRVCKKDGLFHKMQALQEKQQAMQEIRALQENWLFNSMRQAGFNSNAVQHAK